MNTDTPRLTGTFINEISSDIPSQNWGIADWDRDFAAMRSVGIDTVILVRAGFRNRAVFPSKVLSKVVPQLPAYEDLSLMFLDLAAKYGMRLYHGLYNSYNFYRVGLWKKELAINCDLIDEIMERYGAHPAFFGWYLSHEFSFDGMHMIDMYNGLGAKCREVSNRPRLISPYVEGARAQAFTGTANPNQPLRRAPRALTLDEHCENWRNILGSIKDNVDIVAFQDGGVNYEEMPAFTEANSRLVRGHGLTFWSNVETFERDMPPHFPPIEWRKLRHQLELAAPHSDKLITFEFSQFMSPNSVHGAARNLFEHYRAWIGN